MVLPVLRFELRPRSSRANLGLEALLKAGLDTARDGAVERWEILALLEALPEKRAPATVVVFEKS